MMKLARRDHSSRVRRGPSHTLLFASAASLALVTGSTGLLAEAPPANTVIGNQASAVYTDPSGAQQLATSNLVQTTVQQVGAFTLDGINNNTATSTTVQNTKLGAAGVTVYAPHVLTNTGNGADDFNISVLPDSANPFTKVEIFADINGDGLPDGTALCSVTSATSCSAPAQTVAGSNGTFSFVVAYSLPTTASSPTTPYSFGTVSAQVDPGSTILSTYASTVTSDRDNVNLTTSAAFNMTKSLSAPAVAAPGGGTWLGNVVPTSGPRSSSSASCATSYTLGMTSNTSCYYTVYTLTMTNTGGAAGKLVMNDTLPSGYTYVTGSSVWSSKPGTALTEAGGQTDGIDYKVSGNTITAVVDSVPVNTTQTISFIVLVDSDAAVGTSTTTNTANFNPNDAPTATSSSPGPTTTTTNPSPYNVTPTYGFAAGSSSSTTVAGALDTAAGTPNGTTNDKTVQPSVVPGSSVSFTNIIYNSGNVTDAFDLSTIASTFPAGTVFQFFDDTGTPLLNTGGGAAVDTGPIAPGSSKKIVVKAILPTSALVNSGPLDVTVLATSAASPSSQTPGDATLNEVTKVVGSLVDVTNTAAGTGSGVVGGGDLGPGPSPNPTTTLSTPAGVGALFDLYVQNNDSIANTYKLAASQTTAFPGSLPVGWTVKFVNATGTCSSAAITDTGSVAAGAQIHVRACVTPPATAVAGTTNLYFQAQSESVASTGVVVQDTKTDALTVTQAVVYAATLTPDNAGQVNPAGSVVYPHTLTNTGTQTCSGPYTITATIPSDDQAAGWGNPAIYIDNNDDGQIDSGDTLVTGPVAGPLDVGTPQKYLVKVFGPANATPGASSTATVTVTFPSGATSCGAPSATDVTTLITGQIRVQKDQALDADCDGAADVGYSSSPISAKPGACVLYRVKATNQGAAPVTNLVVDDVTPAYTTLSPASAQPATQCTSTGMTGTAVAFATTATGGVSCGSNPNTVAPGGSATLNFSVKINM